MSSVPKDQAIHILENVDPQRSEALARQLANLAEPSVVLLLLGPVGAGKTFFARAMIQHILQKSDQYEDVPSPTFTLVQTYETPDLEIWHSDLYRVNSLDELDELGLFDAFETAFCLIEWPEMITPPPGNAIFFDFEIQSENTRRITVTPAATLAPELLESLNRIIAS